LGSICALAFAFLACLPRFSNCPPGPPNSQGVCRTRRSSLDWLITDHRLPTADRGRRPRCFSVENILTLPEAIRRPVNMKTIAITIDEPLLARLDQLVARQPGRGRSREIRRALDEYVSRLERLAEEQREQQVFRRNKRVMALEGHWGQTTLFPTPCASIRALMSTCCAVLETCLESVESRDSRIHPPALGRLGARKRRGVAPLAGPRSFSLRRRRAGRGLEPCASVAQCHVTRRKDGGDYLQQSEGGAGEDHAEDLPRSRPDRHNAQE
jgi:hypothetical protein